MLGQQEGGIAYHLSIKTAVEERIIRQSSFQETDEVGEPRFRDPDAYTEDERLSAGNMVAILAKVKDLLDYKRITFRDVPHMAIAICNSTRQSRFLLELWRISYHEEPAECYNSDQSKRERENIMKRLKNNKLSLIIIVGSLLEGFDHPSIAANYL